MENPEGPRGTEPGQRRREVMGSEGNSKAAGSLGVSGWRELSCWVILWEAVQVRYGCHGFRRQNWRVVYFPCVHELSEVQFPHL